MQLNPHTSRVVEGDLRHDMLDVMAEDGATDVGVALLRRAGAAQV